MTERIDIDKLARECVGTHKLNSIEGVYQFYKDELTSYTRAVMEECARKCEDNQTKWCAHHAALRDELSTLRAECERLRDGTARPVHIVFDGPPSHESGRFIEVEDSDGVSINAGRWEQRGDFWHLIIDFDTISKAIAGKAQP